MYGFYDIYDTIAEIRRIERLEIACLAQIARDRFIKKITELKNAAFVVQKLKKQFIRRISRINRLLPKGHRWREDVT